MAYQKYATYYIKNPSITIQLERLQSNYDGLDQLAKAISRLLYDWNDVWGTFTIRKSDGMTDVDFMTPAVPEAVTTVVKTNRKAGRAG